MAADFMEMIKPEYLEHYREDKPIQSVYLEFVRRNPGAILDHGEFEALRRWLYSRPDCFPVAITPETSHKVTRDFYKILRKEQKNNTNWGI